MRTYFTLFAFLFLVPVYASATVGYDFLAPLPGFDSEDSSLTSYLISFITLLIGVAGVIGVIRLVICGFELLTAPGESQRNHAKDCILKVVLGLLLAIAAFILLETINPTLNEAEFEIPELAQIEGSRVVPTIPGWYYSYISKKGDNEVYSSSFANEAGCKTGESDRASQGVPIEKPCYNVAPAVAGGQVFCGSRAIPLGYCPDKSNPAVLYSAGAESVARGALKGAGIGVNAEMCKDSCSCSCTNVQGLGGTVQAELVRLSEKVSSDCLPIVITGGTEAHLHASHAVGRPIFDLRQCGSLDAEIKKGTIADSFGSYKKYLNNGFWYTEEGDHWHVCRAGLNDTPACKN